MNRIFGKIHAVSEKPNPLDSSWDEDEETEWGEEDEEEEDESEPEDDE